MQRAGHTLAHGAVLRLFYRLSSLKRRFLESKFFDPKALTSTLYHNFIKNHFSSMFFSEKDTLYASFDYAVALLNYKASRESELDHHVTVFRRFYWLRERKVL